MTGFGSKFLSPAAMTEAVTEVLLLADDQKIKAALVGGVAMQFYGSDRLTVDVDFIAERVPRHIKKIGKLSFGGISGKTPAKGHPVDIIVRKDAFKNIYKEALRNARKVDGVTVVRAEYLAVMKMIARRSKDELDLMTLINSGNLDIKATRKLLVKLLGEYVGEEFDQHVREAEWRKERDKR